MCQNWQVAPNFHIHNDLPVLKNQAMGYSRNLSHHKLVVGGTGCVALYAVAELEVGPGFSGRVRAQG